MGDPMDFYFKVLEIPKDSSPQEIRAAYRALVKKWHPDKHPAASKPQAEAKFKVITQAYEAVNVQEENKATFGFCNDVGDGCGGGGGGGGGRGGGPNKGREAARPSPVPRHRSQELFPQNGSGRDFKDMYSSTGASSPAARPTFLGSARWKPPPVEHKLECTLEELFRGCKKEIKFTRDVLAKNGLIVRKEERHTIKVKPGWRKGTKITFEGMGDDVVILISERQHPIFKRVGNDLVLKVEVPLVNALTGWTFSFPLLSGEKMSCSFHDEIIYPGFEKVLKGQGMPLAHEKGVRGDLRIKFRIIFPTKLTDEQRSSIMELLKDCT